MSLYDVKYSILTNDFNVIQQGKLGVIHLESPLQATWSQESNGILDLDAAFCRLELQNPTRSESFMTTIDCHYLNKRVTITLNVDGNGNLYHIAATSIPESDPDLMLLQVNVESDVWSAGPLLLKPIIARQEVREQNVFLRYWYFILPVAIFFLVTAPADRA